MRRPRYHASALAGFALFLFIVVGAASLGAAAPPVVPPAGQPAQDVSVVNTPTVNVRPNAYVQPFGVPLAPPVYFVNFLLLYFSNPEITANMPAYRAALPQEVYQCLVENPLGCPYADMAPFFSEQALASGGGSRNKNTVWPESCQTDPPWQAFAPREYRRADQINEPLGTRHAEQLARAFGIDQEMILTEEEYACLIGGPGLPQDPFRELIVLCTLEFTNSKGHAVIPLSSYGLFPDEQGGVRSLCASEGTDKAPCLKANEIFVGPLQVIAAECGFEEKLRRLTNRNADARVHRARPRLSGYMGWGLHRRTPLSRQWRPIE